MPVPPQAYMHMANVPCKFPETQESHIIIPFSLMPLLCYPSQKYVHMYKQAHKLSHSIEMLCDTSALFFCI
eukprot:c20775_g1_i1 orf=153-365(+)